MQDNGKEELSGKQKIKGGWRGEEGVDLLVALQNVFY